MIPYDHFIPIVLGATIFPEERTVPPPCAGVTVKVPGSASGCAPLGADTQVRPYDEKIFIFVNGRFLRP